MTQKIEVKGLSKVFEDKRKMVEVLREINFSVESGEFVSIVGPSGCGKSTLLNILAGLIEPTKGEASVHGDKAALGYIIQQDALLPWRTVLSNAMVSFEVGARKGTGRESHGKNVELARKWLSKVGLQGFEDYYPYEISGGMRKRATLVRTLVYRPEVILMDEPFTGVDAQTKIVLEDELLRLWQENRMTVLFVTHDLGEAILLADRVFLMSARPGIIKGIYEVNISRPRTFSEVQNSPEFTKIYHDIWSSLEEEVKVALSLEESTKK